MNSKGFKNPNILVLILTIGVFAVLNTEMGIIGILPEIAEFFNVNIAVAGLFVSMFALIVAISAPITPLIFSKVNRKTTLVFSLVVMFVFTLLSALVRDFYISLFLRIIPAIVHPLYCSMALTVAPEIVDEDKASQAISRVIMGVSAGMVVGVPITAYLASLFGYQMSMMWIAGANLVALIITLIYFPKMPGASSSIRSQVSVAKTGIFILSSIGVIFLMGGYNTGYSYISEFLQSVTNIHGLELSIVLLVYGICSLVGNYVGGNLISKKTATVVLATPIALIAVFLILFFTGNLETSTIILTAVWGLLFGIINVICQYWIVSAAPEAPEFANGIFNSMCNVGNFMGATIGGWLIVGFGTSFFLLGAVAILAISVVLILLRLMKYD